MSYRLLILISLATCVSSSVAAESTAKEAIAVSWSKDLTVAHAQVVKTKRPLLMFFTSPGCGYCKKMQAEAFSNDKICKEINRHFVAVRVDVRKHPAISKQLKLRVYPTTVFISADGKMMQQLPGYKPPATFAKQLEVAKSKLATSQVASKSKASVTR